LISILVGTTQPLLRRGIREIINERTGMVVRGEGTTARELLALMAEQQFHAVLLDMSLPGMAGLDILRQLRETHPEIPVLVISTQHNTKDAVKAIRLGAAGYLHNESAPEELVGAFHRVLRGGKYIPLDLAEELAREVESDDVRPPHQMLSQREYHILCALAAGKSIKEIAFELDISDKTVSTYRMRVLEKLGVSTNADLIRYALERKLV
jgi:two-component system, NarL family, invasion response regulator UvrY